MEDYSQFNEKMKRSAEILEKTIGELESRGLADCMAARRWRSRLEGVGEFSRDHLLKIAVTGPVKSGKSTLINSMIGEDLLKRGAGIVTAFTTRVVVSESPGGWVELKSWEQINREINTSLRMLPVFEEDSGENADLDVRRPEDRDRILFWLERMKSGWLQAGGNLDPNFIFLERCLRGFPLITEEIGEQPSRSIFDPDTLAQHQLYVGDESRAVWVSDIELKYPVPWLGEHIEIADCQGCDSPNRAHFELLQKYLLESHFIIYVIGSRMGLREADFKLLDVLKALRVIPQTLFVLNLDLDLHAGTGDQSAIFERVRSELTWVVPNPRLFAFSALYLLLKQAKETSKYEHRHFKLWKDSKSISRETEAGYSAFRKEFEHQIRSQRSRVLLGSGLSRLEMVAANISDSVRISRSALEKSTDAIQETADRMEARRLALQSTIENLAETVSGINQSLKREMRGIVKACFDPESDGIAGEAIRSVEHHTPKWRRRSTNPDYSTFAREYYTFYLEFRTKLIARLTEDINPRVIAFARDEEVFVRERITETSRALWTFFDEALADYRRGVLEADDKEVELLRFPAGEPDFSNVPLPPPFSSFLDRDRLARGIMFLRFGLRSFSRILSEIRCGMRKSGFPSLKGESVERLFEKAVLQVRAETKSELLRALSACREHLESAYLFRIIDEGSIFLLREFKERAEMTHVDFADLISRSRLKGEQKAAAAEILSRAHQTTSAMIGELRDLRTEIQKNAGI